MDRKRRILRADVEALRQGLGSFPQLDYHPMTGEFLAPYALRVGGETPRAPQILLGTGSAVVLAAIPGLEEAGSLTSDTVLSLRELTESLTVIGGGQIAAEHEHLLSALGGRVPILGRNSRSLPGEGPVQVLVERGSLRLLGADVVGPRASVLLQGVASLMYTPDQSAWPILQGMHIHPALSEGVERAFFSLAPTGGQNGH